MQDDKSKAADQLLKSVAEAVLLQPRVGKVIAEAIANDPRLLEIALSKVDPATLAREMAMAIYHVANTKRTTANNTLLTTFAKISSQAEKLASEMLSEKMYADIKNA